MEISEIKSRLSLVEVISHYNLTPDKNNRLLCPWHNDKTPSLQIYPKTNTWTCFSTNCNAGSGDQIDFIMKYEKISKHEAIMRAKEMLGVQTQTPLDKIAILTKYYQATLSTMQRSSKGKAYAEDRGLVIDKIGYCTYEIGKSWKEGLRRNAEKLGLLKIKNCLIFPMRDAQNQIVSVYGRSISDNNKSRHFYLQGGFRGLYPSYPKQEAKRIILTESIIDAETIKQYTDYEVLAMYGTNGFTKEHSQCISSLKELEEVIFFLDGDEAGIKAVKKWSTEIRKLNDNLKMSNVETPDREDVNSLIQGLKDFAFSNENNNGLDTSNPNKLIFRTETANYYIKGGIRKDLDSLKVTLVIEHKESFKKSRNKVDLYEDKQIMKLIREVSEKLNLRLDLLEMDIQVLIDLLDDYRESEDGEESKREVVVKIGRSR